MFYHFEMKAKQFFWKPSIYSRYKCGMGLRKGNGEISTTVDFMELLVRQERD